MNTTKATYPQTKSFSVYSPSGKETKFTKNEYQQAMAYAQRKGSTLIEITDKGRITLYCPN